MDGLIDATNRAVHRIATELRPGVLDHLGLVPALEWMAEDFQARTGVRCHFTTRLEDLPIERNLVGTVFRIAQEALTNVARHANATRVRVVLEADADGLTLEVVDNGKGIPQTKVAPGGRSLGLLGMQERARNAGGELTITGGQGKGTAVTARIPLEPPRGRRPEQVVPDPGRRPAHDPGPDRG